MDPITLTYVQAGKYYQAFQHSCADRKPRTVLAHPAAAHSSGCIPDCTPGCSLGFPVGCNIRQFGERLAFDRSWALGQRSDCDDCGVVDSTWSMSEGCQWREEQEETNSHEDKYEDKSN